MFVYCEDINFVVSAQGAHRKSQLSYLASQSMLGQPNL